MTLSIDLNSDLGEMADADSRQRDIEILSIVSSCNIACGGHAGDEESMAAMVRYAKHNDVRIGAHPSYPDRANFGRKTMNIDPHTLLNSLQQQINAIITIAREQSAHIAYVKPHGALYNDCADDAGLAKIIIQAVKNTDPALSIMGLPDSEMEKAAIAHSISYIAEGFIDRRYTANARLQNRNIDGAVICDTQQQEAQALALAMGDPIIISDDAKLEIIVNSLCMHSDSPGALSNARNIRDMMIKNNIKISA